MILWGCLGLMIHLLRKIKKAGFVYICTVAHSTSCLSVTTAAAVLAAAAYILQNLLYIFLSSFQNRPKHPQNHFLNCHLRVQCVHTEATFLKTVEAWKRHMPIKDVNFAYMKNIIFLQSYHTMLPAGAGGQGLEWQWVDLLWIFFGVGRIIASEAGEVVWQRGINVLSCCWI